MMIVGTRKMISDCTDYYERKYQDEISSMDDSLISMIRNVIVPHIDADSDYLKTLQVHELLVNNVRYVNSNRAFEHTIEGPVLHRKAVCEGIAKTVKFLLNDVDVACKLVVGDNNNTNPGHMWNAVRINEQWYHVDVTWDICEKERDMYYTYFFSSNSQINERFKRVNCPVSCWDM